MFWRRDQNPIEPNAARIINKNMTSIFEKRPLLDKVVGVGTLMPNAMRNIIAKRNV
jgi:hypothetical protein